MNKRTELKAKNILFFRVKTQWNRMEKQAPNGSDRFGKSEKWNLRWKLFEIGDSLILTNPILGNKM